MGMLKEANDAGFVACVTQLGVQAASAAYLVGMEKDAGFWWSAGQAASKAGRSLVHGAKQTATVLDPTKWGQGANLARKKNTLSHLDNEVDIAKGHLTANHTGARDLTNTELNHWTGRHDQLAKRHGQLNHAVANHPAQIAPKNWQDAQAAKTTAGPHQPYQLPGSPQAGGAAPAAGMQPSLVERYKNLSTGGKVGVGAAALVGTHALTSNQQQPVTQSVFAPPPQQRQKFLGVL